MGWGALEVGCTPEPPCWVDACWMMVLLLTKSITCQPLMRIVSTLLLRNALGCCGYHPILNTWRLRALHTASPLLLEPNYSRGSGSSTMRDSDRGRDRGSGGGPWGRIRQGPPPAVSLGLPQDTQLQGHVQTSGSCSLSPEVWHREAGARTM